MNKLINSGNKNTGNLSGGEAIPRKPERLKTDKENNFNDFEFDSDCDIEMDDDYFNE